MGRSTKYQNEVLTFSQRLSVDAEAPGSRVRRVFQYKRSNRSIGSEASSEEGKSRTGIRGAAGASVDAHS